MGVDALGEVSPAGHDGAAAVDAREVGEAVELRDRGVYAVAHGDEAVVSRPQPALGAREEVLQHHVVGAAGLLAHVNVAHGRHDDAVLDGELVDLDGREETIIGVELLRHARGAAAEAGFSLAFSLLAGQLSYEPTSCWTSASFPMASSQMLTRQQDSVVVYVK